jgi:hypothetical protein
MAIIQGATDSFKKQLMQAVHDLEGDTIKIALYGSTASLGPDTTAYTTTGEVVGTGYTAGGKTLTGGALSISRNVAYADFSDASWPGASFEAYGALIYNSSKANKAIWVLNFGRARLFTSEKNTVKFPQAGYDTAIIRVG